MQQLYRRTPMPKCDFNKVALHNHTSAWCSPVNLLHIFRTAFPKNTSGCLLPVIIGTKPSHPIIIYKTFRKHLTYQFNVSFVFIIKNKEYSNVNDTLEEDKTIGRCFDYLIMKCSTYSANYFAWNISPRLGGYKCQIKYIMGKQRGMRRL